MRRHEDQLPGEAVALVVEDVVVERKPYPSLGRIGPAHDRERRHHGIAQGAAYPGQGWLPGDEVLIVADGRG